MYNARNSNGKKGGADVIINEVEFLFIKIIFDKQEKEKIRPFTNLLPLLIFQILEILDRIINLLFFFSLIGGSFSVKA